MILILTDGTDVHADRMEDLLQRRDRPYLRYDPACFPAESSMTIGFDAEGLRDRRLQHRGADVDLGQVEAVWFRRPGRPRAVAALAAGPVGELIAEESGTAMADLWETLDVPCVPGPRPVVLRAQYKVRQLQLAARVGFELPATLVTTDPSELLDFFSAHGGRVITKQVGLSDLPLTPDGDAAGRYTEPVRHRDLVHAGALRHCPVIVQEYVPKKCELRVTVVGENVLGAAIHSQESNHTRHDWRRYDDANTVMEPYTVPDRVARSCIALTRALGLCYGAIDLVLTPDGRHVFLEINPSGQYLWVEDATGLPITATIADLLSSAPAQSASAPRRAFLRSVS